MLTCAGFCCRSGGITEVFFFSLKLVWSVGLDSFADFFVSPFWGLSPAHVRSSALCFIGCFFYECGVHRRTLDPVSTALAILFPFLVWVMSVFLLSRVNHKILSFLSSFLLLPTNFKTHFGLLERTWSSTDLLRRPKCPWKQHESRSMWMGGKGSSWL